MHFVERTILKEQKMDTLILGDLRYVVSPEAWRGCLVMNKDPDRQYGYSIHIKGASLSSGLLDLFFGVIGADSLDVHHLREMDQDQLIDLWLLSYIFGHATLLEATQRCLLE